MLPKSKVLPVNLLAACFNKTTATYKFYWLLSILQAAEKGSLEISKKELFSRMISNSWFTVNYFNVSFGKQDLIQTAIQSINSYESITIDEKRETVFNSLLMSKNRATQDLLWHFNKNVPHRFLSPWFPKKSKNEIYTLSKTFSGKCMYSLTKDSIEINPEWLDYLTSNAKVLKDFCYWNLALFLQAKNPNVPDIPNKLIKPATRNSLNKQRNNFWDIVLDELGSVNCIYTGQKLTKGNYAVEHFIPYSFVSHDLIWNLIPADKSFNSSKGNKLPALDKYFKPFYMLQKSAYDIVKRKTPKNKFLEDYLTVTHVEQSNLRIDMLKSVIHPLVSIASNNGFEFMK